MKTFEDLEFKEHQNLVMGFIKQAKMTFKNGYGVSVITGGYGNESAPYELAVLFENSLTYNTPITDDVLGYLTEQDVTKIMEQVQKLPK